jgi:hypothetical protein
MENGSIKNVLWRTFCVSLIIGLAFPFSLVSPALAAVPRVVNYQSRLRDASLNPITVPTNIQYTLYSHPTDGAFGDAESSSGPVFWKEVHDGVTCPAITPDADGYFAVQLGVCVAFPSYIDFNQPLYLGVRVGADAEAAPRVIFAAHPYALNAETVDTLHATTTATPNQLLALDNDLNFNISTGTFYGGGLLVNGSSTLQNLTFTVATGTSLELDSYLAIGAIRLDAVGTSNVSSGAYLVGVFDEFDNSNATTVQGALRDLDIGLSAVSSSLSTFDLQAVTDNGNTTTNAIQFAGGTSTGDFNPSVTNGLSLGSSASRWSDVWAGAVHVGTSTWDLEQAVNGAFTLSGDGTERLRILTTNGFVGINQSSPSGLLHLKSAGASIFKVDTQANAQIFNIAESSLSGRANVAFGDLDEMAGQTRFILDDHFSEIQLQSPGLITLGDSDGYNHGNYLALDDPSEVAYLSGFDFGIGTASPSAKLHVLAPYTSSTPIATYENLVGDYQTFNVSGNPEGSVTASPGDIAIDVLNGALYLKTTGIATNTGWERAFTSATGLVTLDSAYDGGGSGAGRFITTDAGPIEITNTTGTLGFLSVQHSVDAEGLWVNNLGDGNAFSARNQGSGAGFYSRNQGTGSGMRIDNNTPNGLGIWVDNPDTGTSIQIDNYSSGLGLLVNNSGPGFGQHILNTGSGMGLNIQNSSSAGLGLYVRQNDGFGIQLDNNTDNSGFVLNNNGTGRGIDIYNASDERGFYMYDVGSKTGFQIDKPLNGGNAIELNVDDGARSFYVVQAGSGEGFWMRNTGTGASLWIEDAASDLSPFVLDAEGRLGISASNTANFMLTVGGHTGPSVHNAYDLGSATSAWRNLYTQGFVSTTALYVNGQLIPTSTGSLQAAYDAGRTINTSGDAAPVEIINPGIDQWEDAFLLTNGGNGGGLAFQTMESSGDYGGRIYFTSDTSDPENGTGGYIYSDHTMEAFEFGYQTAGVRNSSFYIDYSQMALNIPGTQNNGALRVMANNWNVPVLTLVAAGGGGSNVVQFSVGTSTPEGKVTANSGSIYHRVDGIGGNQQMYIKMTDGGTSGWVPVLTASSSIVEADTLQTVTNRGNSTTNTIQFAGGTTTGDFNPSTTNLLSLGSSSTRWSDVWTANLHIGSSTWDVGQSVNGAFTISRGGLETTRIATNGNFGIGTNNPSSALHVVGTARATTGFSANNGTAGSPAFYFTSDADTGMFSPNANLLALTTGGAERVRIDASGNMGVGTSTPGYRLDVFGDARVSAQLMLGRYALNPVSGTQAGSVIYNTASSTPFFWNGTRWVAFATGTTLLPESFTLQVAANNSFAADGYVLFDTGAAIYEDDGGMLQIWAEAGGYEAGLGEAGGSRLYFKSESGPSDPAMIIFHDARVASDTRGIEYGGDYSTGFSLRSLVDKGFVLNYVASSTGALNLQQVTNNGNSTTNTIQFAGGTSTADFIVSGDLGVGTSNPLAPLHVVSDGVLFGTFTNSSNSEGIRFVNDNLGDEIGMSDARTDAIIAAVSKSDLNLFYYGNYVLNVRSDDQRVGINTNSPSSLLHVQGGVTVGDAILTVDSDDGMGDGRDAGIVINSDNGNGSDAAFIKFNNSGTPSGKLYSGLYESGFNVEGNKSFLFRTDNQDRLHIGGDGRIGISTTTPEAIVSIDGSLVGGNRMLEVSNQDDMRGVGLGIDAFGGDLGLYYDRGNHLLVTTYMGGGGGYDYVFLGDRHLTVRQASGFVGIGTDSPLNRLDVMGAISIASSTPATSSYALYNLGGKLYWNGIPISSASSLVDSDGDTKVEVEASPDEDFIRFSTSGTERMYIRKDGRVGIGTDSSLASLLTVGPGSHEASSFSVGGIDGMLNIANFRDKNGENVFRAGGSVADNNLVVGFGDLDYGGNGTGIKVDYASDSIQLSNSELRFYEDASIGNYVGFIAPSALSADTIWTLPSQDGSANQVLVTNGAGILSWATSSAAAANIYNIDGSIPETRSVTVEDGNELRFLDQNNTANQIYIQTDYNTNGNLRIGGRNNDEGSTDHYLEFMDNLNIHSTHGVDIDASTSQVDLRGDSGILTIGGASYFSDQRAAGSRYGLRYESDYSADFVARSLVDKGFVVNYVASSTAALNLQQVTNNGNSTTNTIQFAGGSSEGDFTVNGTLKGLGEFQIEQSGNTLFAIVDDGGGGAAVDALNIYQAGDYAGVAQISLTSIGASSFLKGVSVGGTLADSSAILAAYSTTSGFLMPRMTTTQRNAIASPANGLQVYNITDKAFNYYDGTSWIGLATGTMPTQHWQKNTNVLSPADSSVYQLSVTNNSNSTLTGFKAVNTNDANNYAGAVIELKGSGADFTNNMYFGKYGAGFYIPSWAGNGVLATDKNLVMSAVGASSQMVFQVTGGYSAPLNVMTLTGAGLAFSTGTRIKAFYDDVTLSANSSTAVPTQHAVKTYVDNSIASSTVALTLQAVTDNGQITADWIQFAGATSTADFTLNGSLYLADGEGIYTGNRQTLVMDPNNNYFAGTGNAATTGIGNVGVGVGALAAVTTGMVNTAVGTAALQANTEGNSNQAFGYLALRHNISGSENTAIGRGAMDDNIDGNFNIALGNSALVANSSGSNNVGIGFAALGTNTVGTGNIALGHGADVGSNNLTNAIAIGYLSSVEQSNSMVLGGTGAFSVNVGIATTTPGYRLDVVGHARVSAQFMLGQFASLPATGTQSGALVYNSASSSVHFWDGSSWIVFATGTNTGALGLQQVTDNGNLTTNAIQFAGGTSTGSINPSVTNSLSLGSSSTRWSDVWTANLHIGTSTWDLGQSANGAFTVSRSGSEAMRITADGRVGIGTNSPAFAFDVTTEDSVQSIWRDSVGNGIAIVKGAIGDELGIIDARNDRVIAASSLSDDTHYYYGNKALTVIADGSGTADRVGISTDTPTQALSVAGDAIIGQFDGAIYPIGGASHSLFINAVDGQLPGIQGTANVVFQRNQADLARLGIDTGNRLLFQDYNGASWDTNLAVASTGNVGIGTLNPGAKLQLNGDSSVVDAVLLKFQASQDANIQSEIYLAAGDESTFWDFNSSGAGGALVFMNGASEVGSFLGNGLVINEGGSAGIGLRVEGVSNGYLIYTDAANDRVGIGTNVPNVRFHVVQSGDVVAAFDRTTDDGTIVSLRQGGVEEGTISVSGNTVSYNAFTGSHYAWASSAIEKGMLVSLTGVNRRLHDSPNSEIVYGIEKTSQANHDRVMGAYLSILNPSESQSSDNPSLVMAVGNGEVWVVDNGSDIKAGDYLVSSEVVGHAEKDLRTTDKSYVVARAAEDVTWGDVGGAVDGRKHKLVSVFFENFTRDNSTGALLQGQQAGEQLAADSVVVVEDYEFQGRVVVKGHLTFGGDSVGQAKILSGQTEVRVIFTDEYATQPIVTVSPLDFVDAMYRVTDVNTKGFIIQLNTTQGNDKLFNWHAFGNDGGKVFVSDGTSSTIQVIIRNDFLPLGGSAVVVPSADEPETADGSSEESIENETVTSSEPSTEPVVEAPQTTEPTTPETVLSTDDSGAASGSGSTETPAGLTEPEAETVTP